MFGVVLALIFLIGSISLMIGIIINNQINGTYGSALAVPVYNILCLILALVGLGIAVVADQKNKEMRLAKRTLLFGLICVVMLALLLPFSNSGSLSVIH